MLTHETVIYLLRRLDKDPGKSWMFFNWVCDRKGFKATSSVYSLMLRILLHKDSMKQFWITIRKMSEQGFHIDKETYLTLLGIFKKAKMASDAVALTHFYDRMLQDKATDVIVKNAVDIVTGSNWNENVEIKLGELQLNLSDNLVLRILKELRRYPTKALSFFNWVGRRPNYERSTVTYNAIARVLGQNDSIEEFWSMMKEMKSKGHEMDIDTYIKISRHFQKYKMIEDAVELYELMMDGPYKPSVQDCTILLKNISSSSNPNLDLVFRVTKKYEEMGNPLSKAIYDGIHRSLTRSGKFDEAEEVMEAMRREGCEPDNITYSQLVFGLCNAKRLEDACQLLDKMEVKGCIPDIKTWTILIQGHCENNEVDKAFSLFAKMIEKRCDPDADLLDILINGFLSLKRVKGAYTFLVEMVNKARIRPWQATYKNVILKLLEERSLEEAMELLRSMKRQNYPPFPEPFVTYISKFGSKEDAKEFLKALTVNEYPSSSAYLHLFRSLLEEGRHLEAKDLLYESPHHIRKETNICKLFG